MQKSKRKGLPKKNKKGLELFDFLNDITINKQNVLTNQNKHSYSKFMITRFLSMNENYLPLVDLILNKAQAVLDDEQFHQLCIGLIPKKRVRLQYVKGTPLKNQCKEQINYIVDYFKISENQAFDYYKIGGDDLVENIKKLHGVIE